MENRFKKHPKFEELLGMLPFKRGEREVFFNSDRGIISAIYGMVGRGDYPLDYFMQYKDDQAEEALIGVLEHCLFCKIEELLEEKKLIKKCKSKVYGHDWAVYTGITQIFKYCRDCGIKKDES